MVQQARVNLTGARFCSASNTWSSDKESFPPERPRSTLLVLDHVQSCMHCPTDRISFLGGCTALISGAVTASGGSS